MKDKGSFYQVLLELKDPCHPLLKKLRIKAPGTYFHSVIVSELAATAALSFPKADALLAQVGGLYHDIGKMAIPDAYAENQEDKSYPFRPEVIITHVEKSLEMAEAFHIPEKIQRFMATHHGTQNAPRINPKQINPYPESFRPKTIEETLVMLADSCEAAVRSIRKFDRKGIRKIIHAVFEAKIQNDQLQESVLIQQDLHQIEEDFTSVFLALYHRRHATED
ncbi:HDIG domain-containing protein [Candidatus Peregrinibacteria bacterium]|jgi:cyclic-di-AMP phosphodiesterase PgpH|nr:HDIG domain-containing protein [Candidatus Peregrinibacteria bacterium]